MNKKIISMLIVVIMIRIMTLYAITAKAASDEIELKIETEYIYNAETNTITGIMHSNNELKNTKVSWILSEDGLTYTNTSLKSNGSYTTTVEDIYGNKVDVLIEVTEIDEVGPEIEMEYLYDAKTNMVTGIMHSNEELKNTKKTWKLSEDGLTYTNTSLKSNGSYTTTVEDVWGNKSNVLIDVKAIDEEGPKITLEYRYNSDDTVTISMNSNEKLGDTKPTWTLSEDQIKYEKTYNDNQDYSTPVQDIYGNTTNVYIKLKKKMSSFTGSDGSKIWLGYMYTSDNKVIIQMTSNVKLKDTKPTWSLSEDGYTYTKTFTEDQDYSTPVVNENGTTIDISIKIDWLFKIIYEKGVYGKSGAKVKNISGGTDLQYYRIGNGSNVFFATFCVHGFEDGWAKDGTDLVVIANKFYNKLVDGKDKELAKKWTIYIFNEVNPDGRRLGYTNNGPGRTTLYSSIGKGIDINRCWQTGSSYTRYTDNRNYNGTAGFQAYEATALKEFLLSHKAKNGQTVLVDLHGWENQLIGDGQIGDYYKEKYPSCSTRSYGSYGTQYIISWARQNLGARSTLVELPPYDTDANKYINATLNMLKGI